MTNIQVANGGWASSHIRANDAQGNAQSLGTLTATIDNYAAAYVAKVAVGQFGVVPKVMPPSGGFTTVTVTLHGTSVGGNPLPDVVQSYDLQGPAGAPQATTFFIDSTAAQVGNQPADPGSPTVSLL